MQVALSDQQQNVAFAFVKINMLKKVWPSFVSGAHIERKDLDASEAVNHMKRL